MSQQRPAPVPDCGGARPGSGKGSGVQVTLVNCLGESGDATPVSGRQSRRRYELHRARRIDPTPRRRQEAGQPRAATGGPVSGRRAGPACRGSPYPGRGEFVGHTVADSWPPRRIGITLGAPVAAARRGRWWFSPLQRRWRDKPWSPTRSPRLDPAVRLAGGVRCPGAARWVPWPGPARGPAFWHSRPDGLCILNCRYVSYG